MSLKQKIQELFDRVEADWLNWKPKVAVRYLKPKVLDMLDEATKQIRQKVEEMILGKPAIFALETEYDKGYSKGYYDAKEQIEEILAVLDGEGEKLSDEEIKDVAIAEKEFASGKTKTFKKAEDFIAELHSSRKEEKEKEAKPT